MIIPRNRPYRSHPASSAAAESVPLLQWANGHVEARPSEKGGARFTSWVGWHTECGKDEALDLFAREAGLMRIDVRHRRVKDQSAEIVTHWFLGETIQFFPLTSGPPTTTMSAAWSDQFRRQTIESGLGIRWGAGERSRLAVRGVVRVMTNADRTPLIFPKVVQITVRSLMTNALLAALTDHIRVCEIADDLADPQQHPHAVSLYELALPLGPDEERMWGRQESTVVTPLRSCHPSDITREYLRAMWRPPVVETIAQESWDAVKRWAIVFSGADAGGDGQGDPSTIVALDAAPDAAPDAWNEKAAPWR